MITDAYINFTQNSKFAEKGVRYEDRDWEQENLLVADMMREWFLRWLYASKSERWNKVSWI